MIEHLTNQNAAVESTTMAKKAGRGGRREGAGRKAEFEDRVRFTLDLERADLDALKTLAAEREVSTASLFRKALQTLLRRYGS